MKRFRFAYGARQFAISACRSRREAASFALFTSGSYRSMVEAAFSYGQVRAIVESFDLVYGDPTTDGMDLLLGTGCVGEGQIG